MSSSSRPHPQNTVSYHKYLLQATIQGRPVLSSCQPTVFGVHPGTFRDSATTCQKRHKDTEGAENMRKGIQKLMTSFVRPYAVTQLLTLLHTFCRTCTVHINIQPYVFAKYLKERVSFKYRIGCTYLAITFEVSSSSITNLLLHIPTWSSSHSPFVREEVLPVKTYITSHSDNLF